MGLDVSHGCWEGAYSAFMRWREKLAEVAGLPPLQLMEGFWEPLNLKANGGEDDPAYCGYCNTRIWALGRIQSQLPIPWSCLRPDPLINLLNHSDCDGKIKRSVQKRLADRLEELIPLLPDEDGGGHIGNWREKTRKFVDGLRAAHAANEEVEFH